MSRRVTTAVALLCAFTLAGCGQVDLSKSVQNRTTVKTGDAFTDKALRLVEPCKLYTPELVASLGKDIGQVPSRGGYSSCSLIIGEAATGKKVTLSINLSEHQFSAPKQTGKQLSGLSVNENQTQTGCSEVAITARDPDKGINATVGGDFTGNPCEIGVKLITAVVGSIAKNPPKYEDTPGSLVGRDPCADVDDRTLTSVLGGTTVVKSPETIRDCRFQTGTTGSEKNEITTSYEIGDDPYQYNATAKPTKVDLTDKVKGAAQFKDQYAPNKCVISWVQRALAGGKGENVEVAYSRLDGQQEDSCAKAQIVAKAVAAKLSS
ncbi:hypothetical protein ACFQ1S_02225 [Kibdelosporangium lantanae]|uniref:DUF3558 domain-containing protein n=1 Tax=Kibdelosporangium lantanae TaxID=1497396 RepID=A0ABW3M2Z3_9PSEU